MKRSCLLLLVALSGVAFVSARVFNAGDVARSLKQLPTSSGNAFCPAGCDRQSGGCIQDATMAGLRCQKCLGSLIVNKVNGNCSCPAGKYASAANTCSDCQKGYFCPGGDYTDVATPDQHQCPGNMTTIGKRSVSNRACVQLPGFYYTIDATGTTVGAVECPVDTYSVGLKKQRACVPCPTGFVTNGVTQAKSPSACVVPAGYYLKAPGQVAPCPKGEYKEAFGPNGNCTKCAFGVTTRAEGSTSVDNCTILMPGYYAAAMRGAIVTRTVICPQGYYCPGGSPSTPFVASAPVADGSTIIKCLGDAWTVDVGAQSPEQCLVPPGFYFNGTTTLKCDAGSYRADWKPTAQAPSCTSCGVGVKAASTDQIKVYSILDAAVTTMQPVTTASDDCYILPGQGLYFTSTTATWRVRNCDTNNYGVANLTYGLTPAPCRECPTNMVAINNATYSNSQKYYVSTGGEGGFTNVAACVTVDGYGYNGRVAQPCAKGTYNAKNNYNDCTACDYGLTTADVGAGSTSADCGMAPGFGFDATSNTIRECPIGKYNDQLWQASKTVACTACPTGTTTQATASDKADQCNLCVPGYGGINCNATCGGTGAFAATYGPPGRSPTDPANRECVACTTMTTGFSFEWNMANDAVSVPAISKDMASSSVDCLSKYAQMVDGAWYLPITPHGVNTFNNVATFSDCLTQCDAATNCQYVTYDYATRTCYVRVAVTQVYVGAPVIGFKALPSGDVATNAWKLRDKSGVKGKAVSSGQYTFYQDPNALEIGQYLDSNGNQWGGQKAPANAGSFTKWQDCLSACDDDASCTAFIIEITVDVNARPGTCKLIYGKTNLGEFKRSMTRADIARLTDISGNLK